MNYDYEKDEEAYRKANDWRYQERIENLCRGIVLVPYKPEYEEKDKK